MYIKMSETFMKIDSLQHVEISRQTYPLYTLRRLCEEIYCIIGKTGSKKVVLIATKGCIKAFSREDLDCESELLFIDVSTTNNRKITMGVFYRPPDSNLNVLQDLQNSLSNQRF